MFSAFNTFGRLGAAAGAKSLAQQIAAMSPSLWLEPSVTSGYQDSAGTTALTQPGGGSADPPVGLALDLSGLGNHATQATSTARPKLSARVNLLTYTEDFSNAAWDKTNTTLGSLVAAPDGTITAQRLTINSAFMGPNHTITFAAGIGFLRNRCYFRLVSGNSQLDMTVAPNVGGLLINSFTATAIWQEFTFSNAIDPAATLAWVYFAQDRNASGQPTVIEVWHPQIQLGSTATRYQRVTDASNYDYSGFPFVHVFDGVDDAHVITFPSSLGSACTVVTANHGTTPTIQTGQTIGTSYTITTTHAGKLIFPRALTAAETAIVTAWATKQGAIA